MHPPLWQVGAQRSHYGLAMQPIYIFRHHPNEGPGYLETFLRLRAIPMRLIAVDRGDAVPDDANEASALVFMGGPMSVNDPLPWIADELRLIRMACAAHLPVLGHCLGGQLIAKALGSEVRRNAVKEIGWHPVEQSDASIWLDELPRRFEVFHWHGEAFDLPQGAVPLLRSVWCERQAFMIGNALALQCHIEMTSAMVSEWAEQGRDELQSHSPSVQSPQAMTAELAAHVDALHRVADVIYGRWLDQVQGYHAQR